MDINDLLARRLLQERPRGQDSAQIMALRLQQPQQPGPLLDSGSVWATALSQGLNSFRGAQLERRSERRADEREERNIQRLRELQQAQAQEAASFWQGGQAQQPPMAPAQPPMAPQAGMVAQEPLPPPSAPVVVPEGMYGRNAGAAAVRDANLGADPAQLAALSADRMPPGQPAYNPARPGADAPVPQWDAGLAPPTGRINPGVMPASAPAAMPAAAPAASGAAPGLTGLPPGVSMERLTQALAHPNPLVRQQAAAMVQMAQLQRRETPNMATAAPGSAIFDPRTGRIVGQVPERQPQRETFAPVPAEEVAALGLRPGVPYQRNTTTGQITQIGGGGVTVNTGGTFNDALGRQSAQQLSELQTQARTAVNTVQAGQRIRGLLDQGVITGTFAEGRLGLERALTSLGLIDGRRVTNTEQLMADLANNVLGAAQQMTGVLTDRDILFLREASAGSITLTPETIRRVVEISERGARSLLDRYNAVAGSLGPEIPDVVRQLYQPIQIPGATPPPPPGDPSAAGGGWSIRPVQ
ncbi:MAG TPA: hypothetical protein VGN96_00260 [Roseococcus sp.]|nr:hypothetical protein [Roseococcus sp.]